MFSKVFRVDKKCGGRGGGGRGGGALERRWSGSEHGPAYYPLVHSSLSQHSRSLALHDTGAAESLEQELDLLELVCRSDSLHKRLDELQAKYERMDDGLDTLHTHADAAERSLTVFSSTRNTKSFEGETKKPNFFRRLFGNRLSKSEDDLLDKRPSWSPSSSSGMHDDDTGESGPLPTLPVKERRSASEDVLSWRYLVRLGREKRQSWSAQGGLSDPKTSQQDSKASQQDPKASQLDPKASQQDPKASQQDPKASQQDPKASQQYLMPPPNVQSSQQKFGLKRKRVIRVYNLNSLDQREATMGSTESCSDSTDSEKEFKSRYGGTSLWSGGQGVAACLHHGLGLHAAGGDTTVSPVTRRLPHEVTTKMEGNMQTVNTNIVDPQDGTERKGGVDTDGNVRDMSVGEGKGTVPKRGEKGRSTCESLHSSHDSPHTHASCTSMRTSPHDPRTVQPILKYADKCSESELANVNKTGTASSNEVLLVTTPSAQKHYRTPSSQENSKTTTSQELSFPKTLSSQELSKSSSSGELGECMAISSQELPTRLPTTASIQELDHFLTAIIKNLESQLESGGTIALRPRAATLDGTKRKRKKRKEEEEQEEMEVTQVNPRRCKRMSECGACGRGWVEPRLLPCLHTICTPCLHARATHIMPTSPTPTSSITSTTNTIPVCHPNTTTNLLPTSTPAPDTRSASQEHSLSTTTTTTTAPIITPTTTATHYISTTPTSTLSYNGSQLNRHWNGDGSSCTRLSLSSGSNSSTLSVSTDLRQHHHHHHHTADRHQEPPSSLHENQDTVPEESRDNQREGQHQWTASTDLDSVIELLTNLSPNCSSNNNRTPKVTLTCSSELTSEDDTVSPSTTIDSRCSSRTRSSCESIQKIKGVWIVWCPECGYEAKVPTGGVECFPLNYVLQKQLVLEALNSSSTTVYCDLCHDDVVAEERCDSCPVNLCRLCSHAHTRQRRTTHHTVISLQEARSLGIREVAHTLVCATHGEGEVRWWCRGCHEPLCAACLATLHRGHPTVTVDQEAPQACRKLTALLDQASSRMNELLSTVEDLSGAATRVQQRGRIVSDQVNAFIDDYIMALEEHRHTLLRQVRQACERAQRGIVTESQRAGQTASWLRQGCDLTHDLLHHAGDAEALALAPLVTCRLQTLLSEQVKGCMQWERLALLREHRAGKVRGHRIQGVIADAPAHPQNTRLKPLCDVTNLSAGSRSSALVVARDVDGQPITHGGEEISASVLTKDGATLCGCSVRDREDGSYEVIFIAPVPAAAVLHVTIQGVHVQGSPLELTITSAAAGTSSTSGGDSIRDASQAMTGRRHTGVFHCCTFCSSGGDKTASCACGATMPGGYQGCGHNHTGHPGQKHWSCCGQTSPSGPCTRPPSQYYQVTL
nr:mucin-4-like [Procambarus clarkii]